MRGVLLAGGGALCYGITTVIGRSLAADGVGSATALGLRFAGAAVVLLLLLRVRGTRLLPLPGERVKVVLLGAVGYTLESTLFYLALGHGTAAACILLFYAYPAIVTGIEVLRRRERLTRATALALATAGAGTAVVAVAGGRVAIDGAGVVLALAAATAYAAYLVIGRELGRRSDAMTAACWVAIGAAGSSLLRGVITGGLSDPRGQLPVLTLYGVATAAAFGLTFAALARLGAGPTAVIGTLEAVAATALAALLLRERIGPATAIGGAAVVAAAGVVAWAHRPRSVVRPAADPLTQPASAAEVEEDVSAHGWTISPPAPPPSRAAASRHPEAALGP